LKKLGYQYLPLRMSRSVCSAVRGDIDLKPLPSYWTPSKLKLLMKHLRKSSPSRTPANQHLRSWSQCNWPLREKRKFHSYMDFNVILTPSNGSNCGADKADAYSKASTFPIEISANSHGTSLTNSKERNKLFVNANSDIGHLEKYRALEATVVSIDNTANSISGFNIEKSRDEVSGSWGAKKKRGSRKGSTILKGSNSLVGPSSVEDRAARIRGNLLRSGRQGPCFDDLPEVPSAIRSKEEETNNFLEVPRSNFQSEFQSESCWSIDDDLSETNSIIFMVDDFGDENASVNSSISFQNMKVDWLPQYAQEGSCQWPPCSRQATIHMNILGKEYRLCGKVCMEKLKMQVKQIASWENWLPRFKEMMAEKYLEKIQFIYDKNGYTPLYFAIMYNYPVLVREILQSMDKTMPDILNPFGLMMACVEGYCEVVEILLEGRFPIYCADDIFPTYTHTDSIDLLQGVRHGKAEESSKVKIQALLKKSITARKQELATLFCWVLVEHGQVLESVIDILVEYSIT